jgi:hypothetical protein
MTRLRSRAYQTSSRKQPMAHDDEGNATIERAATCRRPGWSKHGQEKVEDGLSNMQVRGPWPVVRCPLSLSAHALLPALNSWTTLVTGGTDISVEFAGSSVMKAGRHVNDASPRAACATAMASGAAGETLMAPPRGRSITSPGKRCSRPAAWTLSLALPNRNGTRSTTSECAP